MNSKKSTLILVRRETKNVLDSVKEFPQETYDQEVNRFLRQTFNAEKGVNFVAGAI